MLSAISSPAHWRCQTPRVILDVQFNSATTPWAEMRDAVSAEFDLDWVGDPNDDGDYRAVHPDVQYYFGGDSMLATINSPASQTTTVPTGWADKQRIIEILGEVADRHGYSAPVLDHEREYVTEADRRRDFGGGSPAEQVFVSGIIEGPVGQWVMFSLQDPTKDVDGRFEERLSIGDWQRASVTLSYGANALLPAADRAEFERRLQPFLGLEPPEPYES